MFIRSRLHMILHCKLATIGFSMWGDIMLMLLVLLVFNLQAMHDSINSSVFPEQHG